MLNKHLIETNYKLQISNQYIYNVILISETKSIHKEVHIVFIRYYISSVM